MGPIFQAEKNGSCRVPVEMMDIDKIKYLIPAFYGCSGEEGVFLGGDWAIDYELNLNEEFSTEVANLQRGVGLLENALQKNDLIAAKYALIEIRGRSLNLYDFFMNIYDDAERMDWIYQERADFSKEGDFFVVGNCGLGVFFQTENINKIEGLLSRLYDLSGGARIFFNEDGGVGCAVDLDIKLSYDFADFQVALNLLENAVRDGDVVKMAFFLRKLRDCSLVLSKFFKNIFEDIDKNAWSDEAKLPAIPQSYVLPAFYNYPKR